MKTKLTPRLTETRLTETIVKEKDGTEDITQNYEDAPDTSPICKSCGHHKTWHLKNLKSDPFVKAKCIDQLCTCKCEGFK